MTETVAVIDYGMGNLHSVASALGRVRPDVDVRVTDDAAAVAEADRVIFPGVGAIRDCMAEIRRLGFDKAVADFVASGRPILAVCVGLQAVMERSEENDGVECLGILPGEVKYFGEHADAAGHRLKVPHMGWNTVEQTVPHPLWRGIDNGSRFYFVHSYYVKSGDPALVAGACEYGVEFHAALARGNLFAAQFHPEKSGEAGLRLLENFLEWDGVSM